jgi:hypothetical protein
VKKKTYKSSATFQPSFRNSAQYSAADFLGRWDFSGATFTFYGRNFGRLAKLVLRGPGKASLLIQSKHTASEG